VRVLLIISCSLLAFQACKPKSDLVFSQEMLQDIPDTVIGYEEMTDILVDIHIVESIVQESQVDSVRSNRDKILSGYYGHIMLKYGVTQEQFTSSYDYYTDHPLVLNYIYQRVTEQLNLMESKYNKK
jgi:Domain of unknown function (DUF4296)